MTDLSMHVAPSGVAVSANRKVPGYSAHILAQLPMKYLLHEAQKEQQLYAGLFAPLLRFEYVLSDSEIC